MATKLAFPPLLRHLFSRHLSGVALAGLTLFSPDTAMAAGTVAGTQIENVATASFDSPQGRIELESNRVIIRVDELLDVTVESLMPGDVGTAPSASGQVLRFRVTNNGNGTEQFALAADATRGGDQFDPVVQQIVIDADGNGVYDAGVDTLYVAGANDPEILPDQSIVVFVINSIPAGTVDGDKAEVALIARAVTGTGTPGQVFTGLGSGGGDAIVGVNGATGQDSAFFIITNAAVSLIKSATVSDPYGGTNAVPGSVITYRLVATINGTGQLNGMVLRDAIPAGTRYRPESMVLNDVAMTDAADADAASFGSSAVSASLGTVSGGQTHSFTFKVTVE